jgi:hypothetical protein
MKNHPPSAMNQFEFKVNQQTPKSDFVRYINKEPLAGAPAASAATIKATQPAVTSRATLPNLPTSSPASTYTPAYRVYTPNYNYGAVNMGKTPTTMSTPTLRTPKIGTKYLSD